MIEHAVCAFNRRGRLRSPEDLAVDVPAHIPEHVSVIRPAATGNIAADCRKIGRIQRNYIIGRIGRGYGHHGQTLLCRPAQFLPLVRSYAQPHAVDKYHVIPPGLMKSVGRQFTDFHGPAVIRL